MLDVFWFVLHDRSNKFIIVGMRPTREICSIAFVLPSMILLITRSTCGRRTLFFVPLPDIWEYRGYIGV